MASKDFVKDKKIYRFVSFEYEHYYRECTRFYSKFDFDFALNSLRPNDTKLLKRKFKLYKGFKKKILEAFSDDKAADYFEGFLLTILLNLN